MSEEKPGSPIDKRRKRFTYTTSQKKELDEVFARNLYPVKEDIERLATIIPELSTKQIRTYFQNRRAAIRTQGRGGLLVSGSRSAENSPEQIDPEISRIVSQSCLAAIAISTVPTAIQMPSTGGQVIGEQVGGCASESESKSTSPMSPGSISTQIEEIYPMIEISPEVKFVEALRTSSYDDVQNLINQGFDINRLLPAINDYALLFASSRGDTTLVKLLLINGAQISIRNQSSFTALHLAVLSGQKEVVKVLSQCRMCLNDTDIFGRSALHQAVEKRDNAVITMLIDSGCIIDAEDCVGYTPLHVAVWFGLVDIIMILLVAGASIERNAGSKRMSPIALAQSQSAVHSAQVLQILGIFMESRKFRESEMVMPQPVEISQSQPPRQSHTFQTNTEPFSPTPTQLQLMLMLQQLQTAQAQVQHFGFPQSQLESSQTSFQATQPHSTAVLIAPQSPQQTTQSQLPTLQQPTSVSRGGRVQFSLPISRVATPPIQTPQDMEGVEEEFNFSAFMSFPEGDGE